MAKKHENLTIDPPLIYNCKKPTFLQKYALVSFVSPEDMIKNRLLYSLNKFLYHDINSTIVENSNRIATTLNTRLNNMLSKKIDTYLSSNDEVYKLAVAALEDCKQNLTLNVDDESQNVIDKYRIDQELITDKFNNYLIQNRLEIDNEINIKYQNKTSIRGFKIRGVFEDVEEAQLKAKELRELYESFAHIFVAPVGYWIPYDPDPDAITDQDYMVSELNELMGEKKKNSEERDCFFEKRKQEMVDNAKLKQEEQLRNILIKRLEGKKLSENICI
jgi:hypothetical protein